MAKAQQDNKISYMFLFYDVLLQGPETPIWEDSHTFPGVQLDSSAGRPRYGLCSCWGCLHLPSGLWGAHTWTGGHNWTQQQSRLKTKKKRVPCFLSTQSFMRICLQTRDWNEELQTTRELPRKNLPERLLRERAIFKVLPPLCDSGYSDFIL